MAVDLEQKEIKRISLLKRHDRLRNRSRIPAKLMANETPEQKGQNRIVVSQTLTYKVLRII